MVPDSVSAPIPDSATAARTLWVLYAPFALAKFRPLLLTCNLKGHALESLQALVGGYIEKVTVKVPSTGVELDFWVNENGLDYGFPEPRPVDTHRGFVQHLYGPVVVAAFDEEGGTIGVAPDFSGARELADLLNAGT